MTRVLTVLAATFGVILFGLGCAAIFMTFTHGVSGAWAIMDRNFPPAAYLSPLGVLLVAWLFLDGLTSKEQRM